MGNWYCQWDEVFKIDSKLAGAIESICESFLAALEWAEVACGNFEAMSNKIV